MKLTILVCTLVLFSLSVMGQREPGPRQAECSEKFMSGFCPRIIKPVCGTDGNTYDNECFLCYHNVLAEENILVMREGKCI